MEALRFAVLGCATGSLFALVALGIVLVYRSSGVLNFSAGATGAAGAFVFYGLRDDLDVAWPLALILGLLVGVVLGLLTQVAVMTLLRQASTLVKLIATLGVMSLVQGGVSLIWVTEERTPPKSILPAGAKDRVHLFGSDELVITMDRLVIIGLVIALAISLRLIYSKTLMGLATSAVAENRLVAAMCGWRSTPIEMVNFGVAGLLSAGAAILLAPIVGLSASVLTLSVIPALAAALVGNFSSFGLTVAAAMGIGALQAEVQRYVTSDVLTGLSEAVPLLIIIVVTVLRGRSHLGRTGTGMTLPVPGSGHIRWGWLAVGLFVAVVVTLLADPGWAAALTNTFGVAILVLSVVVVTGFGGQISLSQFALAGFGAWVAARLVADEHVPLELAFLASVVATVLLGLLVALPALRTRGVALAVVTMGLALMIQATILNNSVLTGGYLGTNVAGQTLFGWQIDPIEHPQRYALISLALFTVTGLAVAGVRRGRAGLRLLAVRSSERAAASLGVRVYATKLYAFAVGAAVACVAGVAIGFRTPNVLFQQFDVFGSITALEYAVVGGIGWIGGAVIGATLAAGGVIAKAIDSLISLDHWHLVIAGIATLAILVTAPSGQAALVSHQVRELRERLRLRSKDGVHTDAVAPYRRRDPVSLTVDGVGVRFGGVVALSNVSFEVRPGEILGVIGPNGAGKTTLLDVLTGFTSQDTGRVLVDGIPVDNWSPDRRARAGLIRSFQGVELFDELTVRDNLLIAADRHGFGAYISSMIGRGRPRANQPLLDAVRDLELGDVLDARPTDLSHGVARRLGIARAIVAEPRLLFLDEPAAGLDAHERAELAALIRRICERTGIAIILVEHDVPLVTSICDRILVLDFGNVIAIGEPAAIQQDPAVIRAYLGDEAVPVAVPSGTEVAHD